MSNTMYKINGRARKTQKRESGVFPRGQWCVFARHVGPTRQLITLEAWRWTEGNKIVASASVREMWPSSAKSRLSTPKTESARHRVEKVHIPLSMHAQSVTRSWFKNTRADRAVFPADRLSWIPPPRCKLTAHSYRDDWLCGPYILKALHEFRPRSSVRLMPQNQPSGRGLLPSPTAWSPDQHPAVMLADVSRHVLGRTEGRGLGFGQLVRTHTGLRK